MKQTNKSNQTKQKPQTKTKKRMNKITTDRSRFLMKQRLCTRAMRGAIARKLKGFLRRFNVPNVSRGAYVAVAAATAAARSRAHDGRRGIGRRRRTSLSLRSGAPTRRCVHRSLVRGDRRGRGDRGGGGMRWTGHGTNFPWRGVTE